MHNMKAQVVFDIYSKKGMEPDSMFYEFEYPKLPSLVKEGTKRYEYNDWAMIEIYVLVTLEVTAKGKQEVTINPLYDIGNNIPKEDVFWKMMDSSIRDSAKRWKTRPWYFPSDYAPENPYINTTPVFRPFYGQQRHFILLRYVLDVHHVQFSGSLYLLNTPLNYIK